MNAIRIRSNTFLAYFQQFFFSLDLWNILYSALVYWNLRIKRKIELIRCFDIFRWIPFIPTMMNTVHPALWAGWKQIPGNKCFRVETRFRCRSMVHTEPTKKTISIGVRYSTSKTTWRDKNDNTETHFHTWQFQQHSTHSNSTSRSHHWFRKCVLATIFLLEPKTYSESNWKQATNQNTSRQIQKMDGKKYEKVLLALYLQHFELLAMEIEKEKSINKLIGIALSHLFDSIPVASISVASAKGWTRIEKAWFEWKHSMIWKQRIEAANWQ